jgi:hypothetical protein
MTKAFILSPILMSGLAQLDPNITPVERYSMLGLAFAVSAFVWRFWVAREEEKDTKLQNVLKESAEKASAENIRLLEENNHFQELNVELNQQIINLLRERVQDGKHVCINDKEPIKVTEVHQL